jgi:probable F420-dependent oxidoreductase
MATRGVCVLAGGMAETAEVAATADAAGFDAAWTSEFNDRSAIVALAAMAYNTTSCRIGSGIAYGVGRSPLILANDARGLDEISGGRLVLGLGTGTKGMQIGWHGVKDPQSPAVRLEELVPLIRRIWRLHEGPVKHEGRFYSMNLTPTADVRQPLRDRIPIYTAGVNRRMIETAGRVSDGLVCHPTFSSRYVHDVVRPAIAAGADRTGRDLRDVQVVGMLLCSINDDEEIARQELAAQIAFYAAPRAYAPMLAASGFDAEAARIREAFVAGDHAAMIEAVSDDMIDAIGVAGTPDQVRAGIARREDDFDHVALYSPSFRMTLERVQRNTLDLIRVGASSQVVS